MISNNNRLVLGGELWRWFDVNLRQSVIFFTPVWSSSYDCFVWYCFYDCSVWYCFYDSFMWYCSFIPVWSCFYHCLEVAQDSTNNFRSHACKTIFTFLGFKIFPKVNPPWYWLNLLTFISNLPYICFYSPFLLKFFHLLIFLFTVLFAFLFTF